MAKNLTLIYGAATITSGFGFEKDETVQSMLDAVAELGIKNLDTAYIYGDSEERLGKLSATSRFTVDTKFPGGFAFDESITSSKEDVVRIVKESLRRLNSDSVDTLYIHAPDTKIPLEETLAGLNELHQAGAFRQLGLSNYAAEDVEEAVRICQAHGWVAPTVYQGNYNAFAQHVAANLLPTLRRHNIAFRAYSPSAGGFLAKRASELRGGAGTGRWDPREKMVGGLYHALYGSEPLLAALDAWNAAADAEGLAGIAMAYRWVAHHSALDPARGDALLLGARSPEQLRQVVAWIRAGPLSAEAVARIDAIWDGIAPYAPVDNYHSYVKKMKE
ncbi:aldehyde reductase [Hypoxylon sp. FL1284]|nr:aldehyde reductase [Hypoxylon sp. FL1284]